MTDPNQLAGDLAYVRATVQKAEGQDAPAMIYFLWAGIVLVGFALVDIAAQYTGMFWLIAGPAGGIVSFFLGRRHAIRRGTISRDEGRRHAWHWSGLFVAILLSLLLFAGQTVPPENFPQLVLLIIAISYFYAGVHLDRPLIWVAVTLAGGYVAVGFLSGPVWTVVGALVAASLGIVGFSRIRAARARTE